MRLFDEEPDSSMILMMGVTGVGKSYFINKLATGSVSEGSGLRSETEICRAIRIGVGNHQVAVIDTPGFDDSDRSDVEILEEIVEFLCAQYELGIPLKGIIYMHRITDNKMSGTAQRYFEMFKYLCGEANLSNVILLTTMWDELKDEAVGLGRERELRRDFWNVMEKKGSTVRRFDGSREMAEGLVCRLMRKPNVVLDIQSELVDQGKRLDETKAGSFMVPGLNKIIGESAEQIDSLGKMIADDKAQLSAEQRRGLEVQRESLVDRRQRDLARRERLHTRPGPRIAEKIEQEKKEGKWKGRLALFASLVGVALSATVNVILPLAGVIAF
ncbi:P-loop containing nucleoside triphosphate hydrolase protein [Polyplosphaeria fusca]|uniref:P-loop containing nucleoside triphosphate hydrolase protein n=1 Tax=Polyplosphaeria fusca TaxID=682080 RepID=A0A9P4QHJ9_9PLEO|nr:P-loop containing nucleoside triphosphate hydrolase protein [Polyplosphaeria fusca]